MDSTMYIEDSPSSFDSPPPRTSEDRHPLNEDGPRFVFDEEDDEFAAWQDGNDDDDHGHVDAGARTPLAEDRSQTPQPPALTAPPPESYDSAEDSLITPVEPPKSTPELPAAAASVAEPESEPESTSAPAAPEPSPPPAEVPEPTPSIEHEQPDIEAIDTEALHKTNPSAETPEEHSQEHNYEHQGETTRLEEAVQESAQVPLAEDTDSPALEWAASDGAFDKGSQQHEPLLEAQPDSGAVAEHIEQAETEAEQAPALDFGDSGDGGFDLGGPMSAADAPLQVEEEKTRSQPTAAEDTASAANLDWGAAGEEDFSLEGPQQSAASGSEQPSEPARAEEKTTEETGAAGSLDWGNAAHADFDLGATAAPSQEPLAEAPKTETEPAAEASSAETAPPAEQQSAVPDLDWGSTGDDDFGFGASAETSEALQPSQQQTEEPTKEEEKDLSAMWAEALADDDLLEETSVDPSAFFLDDDDGFLDDSPPSTQNGATQVNGAATAPATTNKYAPAVPQAPPAASKNPYAPQGLQTTNVAQPAQAPAQASPYGVYNQAYQQPQPPQRPSMPGSAQSFADKAKGGYASPFDLPEDLAKQPPRKKIVHAPTVPSPTTRGPPPRTPSMYSNPSSPALGPPANYGPSPTSAPSPNTPSGGFPGQPPSKAPSLTSKPSTGDFFEDLPVVPKPRPSGRYTPQVVKGPTPPPMSGPPSRQASQTYAPPVVPPPVGAQPQRPDSQPSQASQVYAAPAAPQRSSSYAPPTVQQLQQPERLNPFPDAPQQPQGLGVSSAPPATSRYSPAPPGVTAATSRYSPAPPSAPAASRYSPAPPPSVPSAAQNRYAVEPSAPPKPPALPFAPRTSSPLAYHSTPDHPVQRPSSSGSRRASLQPSVASGDDHLVGHSRPSLEQVREVPDQGEKPATPPPPRSVPGSAVGSPARRTTANYTPQYQSITSPPGQSGVAPPRRAQSQSPGATMKGPILSMAHIDRPASTNGVTSPTITAPSHAPFAAAPPTSQPAAAGGVTQQRRRRTFSRDLSYVKPTDETVEDPLERWKGAPILRWGLGGTILTTFPKEIPRYGTGGVMPMVKCTPGEVKIQKAKELCPLWDPIAKFPGPLKTKSQKKQALTWLQQSIETMEQDYQSKIFNGELPGEVRIRFEEKILLWKVLEVFVEHDGQLEGSDTVNLAVKKVLLTGQVDQPQLSSPVDIMGASATTGSVNTAEPIDPQSVEQLRAHLLKGDREKAVWEAADKRLWGHSMLIASTMSKDIWKQVVQEFVRQEVRKVSGNNQSLAALYEVFAGNWEESIDELVPASARAGFQMVSKTDRSGANTNVFEGLDRWRETLMLIVNNRSEGDPQALVALGKLLAGYGRVEAAHICYLFARSAVVLSGADDPSAHVVLIGADHVNQRHELGRDIEPILLTEVYEFAISLSPPPAYAGLPHLQAFKLAHALMLAEYGYKTEAQAYCDAITTAMKSTTRISPYYNASLVQELDDLVKRLSEAPKDSSSWISKPSMGKVSSSVWSSFNKFVAGDDDDADSTGPGGNDTSPFAKVTGDTPSVSRSPSTVDMYGTYSGGAPLAPPSTIAGSRYAPSAGPYAPRTSGEQARSRYEPVGQSPYQPARPSAESGERPDIPKDALFAHQGTPPSSYNPSPMQFSQQAKPQNAYAPTSGPMSAGSSPNPLGSPYTPTNAGFQSLGAPTNDQRSTSSYEPPTSSFGPPLGSQEGASNSYEPPASSYEPPSYQPYEPEPEAEEEEKPKKKSFMDDDDDDELERRAAALKAQQKAEADRIAEENFRKAAEADAQKASAPKKTGSWLGGWFKKSESNEQQGNKPIRAKLGEENSFYYDPDLKKWVNKKAGAQDQAKPAATPPPPKGGPPPLRTAASMASLGSPPGASKLSPSAGTPPPPPNMRSTSMPPPMAASAPGSGAATPNRMDSPAPPTGGPPTAAGTPGGGAGPAQPPSRPATSMSNASSIDDLLGVPAPRKGGAPKKKGRSGRYVDVMAK
ncbi:hypothetical protein MPH_03019 [Macrophomina phaseolina MS6]|uniref:Protein transport protein sec16 n=1 Tax=Macrophomina phaseolina (strain MS6) TaxID=1126212 RepID=K2S3U8_MACPH|nr:hypothetical protein MPH_03019 [Macrophomina phaseolina MS6]